MGEVGEQGARAHTRNGTGSERNNVNSPCEIQRDGSSAASLQVFFRVFLAGGGLQKKTKNFKFTVR